MRLSSPHLAACILALLLRLAAGWTVASAQDTATLSGSVVDAITGQPLAGASIFAGHTSRGTIADTNGMYRIEQVPPGSYELVASMVGYAPRVIQVEAVAAAVLNTDFRLQPAVHEIDSMVVVGERSRRWERNLARFTRLFIGTTPNAEATRILNPNVLRFQDRGGVLVAEAVEPLRIENDALGYRLTFVLVEFRARRNDVTFWGYPYFEEMEARSEEETLRWKENRENTYRGSFRHILRALASDRLEEEGFVVREARRPGVTGSPMHLRARRIITPTSRPYEYILAFDRSLHVTYTEASREHSRSFWRSLWRNDPSPTQTSWLTLTSERVLVNERGYVYPTNAVLLSGTMGEDRIADQLPHEYVPEHPATRESDDREQVEWIVGETIARPSAAYAWVQPLIEEKDWGAISRLTSAILERDPADLEARYYRAVACREAGIIRTLFGGNQWARSTDDFEAILAVDSSYQDVLYQYALLKRYAWRYIDALEIGNAQVFAKPGSRLMRFALLDLYRHAALFGDPGELTAWLEAHPSSFAAYARAELLRRSGDLEMAASLHRRLAERMLKHPPIFPMQAIYLALARIHYAQDEPEDAEALVERAIAEITRAEDAAVVFNDFKYVFSPEELERYQALERPGEYREFFRVFWTGRDPTPAQAANVRLAEHYRRLLVAEQEHLYPGFRHWHNNPDRTASLEFPSTYRLSEVFNDKGAIFIRHGEPADRVLTVGGMDEPDVESWRYNRPAMDFHFTRAGAVENGWRLTPEVYGRALASLEEWGFPYRWGNPGDMADSSRRYVMLALTTDRHTWPDDLVPIDIPLLSTAFRGEGGRTRMEYAYALPLGALSRHADTGDTLDVEVGVILHDRRWTPAAWQTDTKHLAAKPSDRKAAVVDQLHLHVMPDSYRVALHARSLTTSHLGGYRFAEHVPDLSGPGLRMSGILPAYAIGPAREGSRPDRGGLHVDVNPFRTFSVEQPVFVYFEVYGLTRGADDLTHYGIRYTLRQEGRRGLFGGRREGIALTLEIEGSGSEADPVEYAEIDVSRVSPGDYQLEITVIDLLTGAATSQSRALKLTR